jgi:hypothetical protein
MEKRLFDVDPLTGARQYFYYDEMADESIIETVQDVEPLFDINAATFNSTDSRARWGEGQMVARLPLNIWWDLKQKGVIDDQKKFARWLNDSENMKFRTRPGRV